MFLLNSRLGLFTATMLPWHSLSRSYGVILPSSLTMLLPIVLGFSPRLPVSVCGTGTFKLPSSFSCQCGFTDFHTCFLSPSHLRLFVSRTSLTHTLSAWTPSTIKALLLSSCVTASVNRLSVVQEYQPVVHRLRLYCPRLRSRLTLGGRAFPRKP